VHPTCIRLWCHPHRCPIYTVHGSKYPIWVADYITCICMCFLFLRCPAVGHVLAWWLCCCKMRPGSACGGWLFAVTVYYIMVTVARWFVIWWLTGRVWILRLWVCGGFFFLFEECNLPVHDSVLASVWGVFGSWWVGLSYVCCILVCFTTPSCAALDRFG